MDRKLRVAIMGGGGILNQHAPGFTRMSEVCEVVAVAEPDESRYANIRRILQNPDIVFYKSYTDLYERDDIDAVDIILPHHLHLDATVRAAQKGWHVLTEKVMARNTWECERMIEACQNAGVSLVVCHDRRYAGDWVALKRVIETGVLGDVLFWRLDHNQDVLTPEGHWIRSLDAIGGGAIMSCLTHQIDALRWMGGEIDEVSAMTLVEQNRMEGESIGVVTARMASGALAMLYIDWFSQQQSGRHNLWYESIHITGTKGEAYYMSGKGTFVKPRNALDSRREYQAGDISFAFEPGDADFVKIEHAHIGSGHIKCVEEFVKAARGEQAEILTDGKDTIKTVEVAEAAYVANARKTTVSLPVARVPWDERSY